MEVKKKLFKISLASANITEAAFARRHRVSKQAVNAVLANKIVSERLDKLIEAFVIRELHKLKIRLEVWHQNRAAAEAATQNSAALQQLTQQL